VAKPMRYVMLVVEQLERATRELATDHQINNRIALLLVDNAAELIVHHRLEHRLRSESTVRRLSPGQRVAACGQHFGDRLNVLRHLDDLSETEVDFIKVAHQYRGELYHAGLRHKAIIRPITFVYFDLVCDLFVRLPRGSRQHFHGDTFTDRLATLLGTDVNRLLSVKDDEIVAKLRAALPSDIPALLAALAKAAHAAIDRMEESMNFIVEENPNKLTAAELLVMAQRTFDFTRALTVDGIEVTWRTPGYQDTVNEVHAEFERSWQPKYRHVPLDRWRTRANAIGTEDSYLKALVKYHQLRKEGTYLFEVIDEYAAGVDHYIQMQIDEARGK
jgi:hypothetical protein